MNYLDIFYLFFGKYIKILFILNKLRVKNNFRLSLMETLFKLFFAILKTF